MNSVVINSLLCQIKAKIMVCGFFCWHSPFATYSLGCEISRNLVCAWTINTSPHTKCRIKPIRNTSRKTCLLRQIKAELKVKRRVLLCERRAFETSTEAATPHKHLVFFNAHDSKIKNCTGKANHLMYAQPKSG